MPIYEFYCEEHGRFENLCKIGEDKKECPYCNSICGKVVSKASFVMGNKTYNVPRDVDMAIGRAAEKGWEKFYERKERREKEAKKTKKAT